MHSHAPSVRFRRAWAARLLVTLCLGAGPTLASPDYPTVVEDTVKMTCTPDCTLCHLASPGNDSPADQPFRRMLQGHAGGITGGSNSAQLIKALNAAMTATPPTNADGDGVPDFEELKQKQIHPEFGQETTNPNVPEGPSSPSADICPPEAVYGCGASHVAPKPHVHGDYLWLGLLAAGLLTLAVWRRAPLRPELRDSPHRGRQPRPRR